MQLTSRRSRQQLGQGGAEHVRAQRVPEPADALSELLLHLIPGLVVEEVEAVHPFFRRGQGCRGRVMPSARASLA